MVRKSSILRTIQPLRTRTVRLPADLHERLARIEQAAESIGAALPIDDLVTRALRGVVRDAEAELREAGALPAEDAKGKSAADGKGKPAGAAAAAPAAEVKPQPETKPSATGGVAGMFSGRPATPDSKE